MASAYAAADWTAFATAAAATAATLAGLLFVAVSINLQRILHYENLPNRAALTLILLTTPLVSSLLLLAYSQPLAALGAELLAAGLLIGTAQVVIDLRTVRVKEETRVTWLVGRIFPAVTSSSCLAAAGASLLTGGGGGLIWLLPSALAAFVFGLLNAWVLLVEIMR